MRPKSDLRPYQPRVITRLYESDAVLAVLKMGAGKTVCGLTAIAELIADRQIRHALVIAPKRVASLVWPVEAKGWEHTRHLRVATLDGSVANRRRLLDDYLDRDVTVCGVDNVQWLVKELEQLDPDGAIFDLLAVDETSRFKDPASKRGHALRRIAGRFQIRWGFTGTPRPNSLMDLWGPMTIIAQGELWRGSFYKWRKSRFYPVDYKGYDWQPLPGQDEATMAEVAPFTITLPDDELPGLPDLNVIVDEVTMPPEAQLTYRSMERRLITGTKDGEIIASSAAVATGKLAQISNGFVYGDGGATNVTAVHDAKRDWLRETIDSLDGEPALVVYGFVEDCVIIRSVLGDIPFLGKDTDANARRAIERWQRREIPYLGLHPASGGHGLNLQAGGSTMLWMAPTWSPEMWEQTIARLWRSGQSERVTVRVCCASGTVDHMKRRRVIDRLGEQAAFEEYLQTAGLTVGRPVPTP